MTNNSPYTKIVEWSNEDQCYVGSCPELFYGGCHGSDEKQVFSELCELVEETLLLQKDQDPPPSPQQPSSLPGKPE